MPQAVKMAAPILRQFLNSPFHSRMGGPNFFPGGLSSWAVPGKHPNPMPCSTWPLWGVHSRGTRVKQDHRYSLPLCGLNLLNPLTSWELEEKPSSLRLVLSLVVGLSVEATGPISLWAPLCVSFCFLASFLWDMCKGKNHSQMVPVALRRPDCSPSPPIILNHKPGSVSSNRVKVSPPVSRWNKPKSF